MGSVKQIADIVFGVIIGAISLGGGLFGGFALYEGLTADQPDQKKKGITSLIIVVLLVIALYQLKPVIYGLAGI